MDREDLQATLERWDTVRAELAAFPYDMLTTTERLAMVERVERAQRQDLALAHTVLAAFAADADPRVFGERTLLKVLATRLHLTDDDAGNRIKDAQQLGPRRTLTGDALPPLLERTAAALADGKISAAHVAVIQEFFNSLPSWVGTAAREDAEHTLARKATGLHPKALRETARQIFDTLDPDGAEPNEELEQRQRFIDIGPQRRDGTSRLNGVIDAETRAYFDVLNAKRGAPGANLPDTRSRGQRHHDALKTTLRDAVGSGLLGQINGLPATIVATTTVDQLENAAGWADTAGGTRLPMRDLIRMAGQSRHYLAVFDDHTNEVLYFGRARRCASTAQRLAMFARDKGCTRPGCTKPAYQCEAHHETDYADGGLTNIDELALACRPDNLTVEQTEWSTRRRNGRTEWLPPPTLDTGQTRVNEYFYPERYLREDADDDDEPG